MTRPDERWIPASVRAQSTTGVFQVGQPPSQVTFQDDDAILAAGDADRGPPPANTAPPNTSLCRDSLLTMAGLEIFSDSGEVAPVRRHPERGGPGLFAGWHCAHSA